MSAIASFGVWRAAALVASVAATLLAAPASARAATSCDFIATSRLLNVEMSAAGDGAVLRVSPDGDIVVSAGGGELVCFGTGGPASVTNTDVIQAFSQPGASANTVAIVGPSRFAPGASVTDENGGDAEIEIRVMLRGDPDSLLELVADDGGESIRFGSDGINPNALDTEVEPDADIQLDGVASVAGVGGPDPDTLGAQGGAGTGKALTDGVQLLGLSGADRLTGGDGADDLAGGSATTCWMDAAGQTGSRAVRERTRSTCVTVGQTAPTAAARSTPSPRTCRGSTR